MTQLAEIEGRLAGMGELQDIVGAMRSLAAIRMQEALRALPGIRRYAESLEMAIATALQLVPSPPEQASGEPDRRLLVLCAAEHGFSGGFDERLVQAAQAALAAGGTLAVLGLRGAALALERGLPVAWSAPMATRAVGAPDAIEHLVRELYARIARGEVARVEAMFGRYRQGAAATVERRLLLPLDTTSLAATHPRQPPMRHLAPRTLLERLIAEYVFALLTEAAVESISSENAARFAAMESARDNVSRKLEELRRGVQQARQAEITAELLDLITGAAALEAPTARRGYQATKIRYQVAPPSASARP